MQPVTQVRWSLHSKNQRTTAPPLLTVDVSYNTTIRKTLTASPQLTITLLKPSITDKHQTSFTHACNQIIFSTQSLTVRVGASERYSEKQPGLRTPTFHFPNLHCKVTRTT